MKAASLSVLVAQVLLIIAIGAEDEDHCGPGMNPTNCTTCEPPCGQMGGACVADCSNENIYCKCDFGLVAPYQNAPCCVANCSITTC